MRVSISPLDSPVGAELHLSDVGALDESERRWLRRVLAEQAVLVVRASTITPAEHIELSRVFGEPELHPVVRLRVDGMPEIIELADPEPSDADNPDELIGQLPWHTDLSYTEDLNRASLLYGAEIPPEGGRTGFVDLAQAYQALPTELRARVDQLEAVHSWNKWEVNRHDYIKEPQPSDDSQSAEFPDVTHPLVHRHPVSFVPVLNLSPMFTESIVGLSEEDGRKLLAELYEFATQREFSYLHEWSKGDLVIWDNWRTMHSATGHPRRYPRRMHRTTIRGGTTLVGIR
jgi:taurine dioxygenase